MQKITRRYISSMFPLLALFILLTACATQPTDAPATGNGANTPAAQGQQRATPTTSSAASGQTSADAPVLPLTHIRMIDRLNGWALTKSAMLHTADGGQHWKDVTQRGQGGSAMDAGAGALPIFQSATRAWVFEPIPHKTQTLGVDIIIWRTSDGGQSWQRSELIDKEAFEIADRPNFSDAQHGWILLTGSGAAGSQGADLYQTVDGGQTWTLAAKAPGTLPFSGHKTGPTFFSAQRGWIANYVGALADAPLLYFSGDSGKSWSEVRLPTVYGLTNAFYETTPPICFGEQKKVVPVHVHLSDGSSALAMYGVAESGRWGSYMTKTFDTQNVYVLSMLQYWALDKSTLYGTIDAGQNWTKLASLPATTSEMTFIDAQQGWIIDSNAPVLYHTTDGGHNWSKISYSIQ